MVRARLESEATYQFYELLQILQSNYKSHTQKNQKVIWIRSKPTWSLSQKFEKPFASDPLKQLQVYMSIYTK